jgi:hypothetical protein
LFIRVADSGRGVVVVEKAMTTPITQRTAINSHIAGFAPQPMNVSTEGAATPVLPWDCTSDLADFMATMDLIEADYTRRFPT